MKSGDEGREKGIEVQQRTDVGKRIPTSLQRRAVYTAGFRGNKRVKTFTTLRRAFARVVVIVVVVVGKLSCVKL